MHVLRTRDGETIEIIVKCEAERTYVTLMSGQGSDRRRLFLLPAEAVEVARLLLNDATMASALQEAYEEGKGLDHD